MQWFNYVSLIFITFCLTSSAQNVSSELELDFSSLPLSPEHFELGLLSDFLLPFLQDQLNYLQDGADEFDLSPLSPAAQLQPRSNQIDEYHAFTIFEPNSPPDLLRDLSSDKAPKRKTDRNRQSDLGKRRKLQSPRCIQNGSNEIELGALSLPLQFPVIQQEPKSNPVLEHSTVAVSSRKADDKILKKNGVLIDRSVKKAFAYSTSNELFKCPICNRIFNQKNSLTAHMAIHADEKFFKCSMCNQVFNFKSTLIRHMKVHSSERPFKCPTCNRSFKTKSNLNRHMKEHSTVKSYKCSICNTSFKIKSSLTLHMTVHSSERPFKCPTCNKSFKWKNGLMQHMGVHSDERPFKCSTCNKSFKYRSSLVQHMRGHSNKKFFKCPTCNKSFKWRSNLAKHMGVHSSEKPFKCLTCNKSFKLRQYLAQHMKGHSSEKSFKCSICSQVFKWQSSLSKHTKRLHS